jgi:UDP-GlcNAc:undecaprenyl-phosphate GlcNAc-1-phosphate transferase
VLVFSLLAFAGGLVAATLLTPVVGRLSLARGWLDQPDGGRKSHTQPVPAVGGLAVVGAMFFALIAVVLARAESTADVAESAALLVPLLLAAGMVTAVGLLDDVRGVTPWVKLAVQTGAALLLCFSGFRIQGLSNPFGGSVDIGVLAIPLTVVWLVGMSNAFNLIDGLDGLAAGLGFVATLGLLAAAAVSGRPDATLVAAALAGALLGFLPYNFGFKPARIFLGDCGALTVGFTLAAIAVRGSIKTSATIAVVVPLLALALPILDVILAVVRRFVRRRPIFGADQDHIHHRLVALGLTPRRAVLTLYAVAVLCTALALAAAMGPRQVGWAAALLGLLLLWRGVRALGYWEVPELQRVLLKRLAVRARPPGDGALRGLEEDLRKADSLEGAWDRICETAWSLGFEELHVEPRRQSAQDCPELHAFAAATPPSPQRRGFPDKATWSFFVQIGGEPVARVVARRPLDRADFEPRRFVAAIECLVRQGARWPAEAESSSQPQRPLPARSAVSASLAPVRSPQPSVGGSRP